MVITKDTQIGELLRISPQAAVVLMQNGMHCVGCPASAMESIGQASAVHGMDADSIVEQINLLLGSANEEQ